MNSNRLIENEEVLRKILNDLDLWEVKPGPSPPSAKAWLTYAEPWIDESDSQAAPCGNGLYPLTLVQKAESSLSC